jgi:putative phage-type endonuclease
MNAEQRRDWLAQRRAGLGSSDSAAVLGLDPYKSALEVALDKWGELPPRNSAPMAWGLKMEEVIALAYLEETGQEPGAPPAAILWHPSAPWMFASLDRLVAGRRIVELKNARTSEGWGRPGTDEVPEHYQIQVQHQLHVGVSHGLDTCADVAVLIGGSDFRVYRVHYNQDFCGNLEMQLKAFWERVLERKAPPLDWDDPDVPRLVQYLHKPKEGTSTVLDVAATSLLHRYEEIGREICALEAARQRYKAMVIESMGDACEGYLSDGRVVRRRQITRREYRVPESTYQDFRITGPKGSNYVCRSDN